MYVFMYINDRRLLGESFEGKGVKIGGMEKGCMNALTFLGVEEEESLVKSKTVIVGLRRPGLVSGHGLGDDNGESDDEEEEEEGPEGPLKESSLAHDAS